MNITTLEDLRTLYAQPRERSVLKQLSALDRHCIRFVELSPFVVLATAGADGKLDASPRGGAPGFVQVVDATTVLLPDAPGNNRLDSLTNIVAAPQVGLLFMVPGVDETLRINGEAALSAEEADIQRCIDERRTPKLVIRVTVREAYLHCAKALMRSKLWNPQGHVDRATLPSMGQMINEQAGIKTPAETQEEMLVRYSKDL